MSRSTITLLALLLSGQTALAESLDCLVAPRQVADLAFGAPGVVREVKVDRGDLIKRGERLARQDTAVDMANLAIAQARVEEAATMASAEAQFQVAERRLGRARTLQSKNVLAESKLDDTRLEHEAARLKVAELTEAVRLKELDATRARALLELRHIVSPFDGVVVERHVAPGEYVENKRALTVAQIDPVFIDVIAPAALFAKVNKGRIIKVTLQMPQGKVVDAETAMIDPFVDAASSTFRLRLLVPNANLAIVPGFRCKAEVGGETD